MQVRSYQGIASAMPKALCCEYAFRHCLLESPSLWTVPDDLDLTSVLAHSLQRNLHIPLLLQAEEFFSPLNQQNAVVGAQVIQCERFQFALRVHAIKINVIEIRSRTAILMHQGEGRTGHVFFGGCVKRRRDSFYQRGLACAEIAAQEHQLWRGKHLGQRAT